MDVHCLRHLTWHCVETVRSVVQSMMSFNAMIMSADDKTATLFCDYSLALDKQNDLLPWTATDLMLVSSAAPTPDSFDVSRDKSNLLNGEWNEKMISSRPSESNHSHSQESDADCLQEFVEWSLSGFETCWLLNVNYSGNETRYWRSRLGWAFSSFAYLMHTALKVKRGKQVAPTGAIWPQVTLSILNRQGHGFPCYHQYIWTFLETDFAGYDEFIQKSRFNRELED